MLSETSIREGAARLLDAERNRSDIPPLTDEWLDLDPFDAYRIQDESLRARLDRGEVIVGVKLGLTSAAKQRQMGVATPLTAWLTDAMRLAPDEPLPWPRLIHPRVEPEIVFVMGERLEGPGVTPEMALRAVEAVTCGLEVIDSRYTDFRFRLPDVVADNASAAAFVTGERGFHPRDVDLAAEECVIALDGVDMRSGSGAEVYGHPAAALAFAVNVVAERGFAIEAGWTVLTGGITDAIVPTTGTTVTARFERLGTVSLHC